VTVYFPVCHFKFNIRVPASKFTKLLVVAGAMRNCVSSSRNYCETSVLSQYMLFDRSLRFSVSL